MPTYCYRRLSDNALIERIMSVAEMECRQDAEGNIELEDGQKAVRSYPDECGKRRDGDHADTWPRLSNSLGCHPDQAPEFNRKYAHGMGLNVHWREDGVCVLGDKRSRKRLCEARGLVDYDAACGDPVPSHG